MWRSNMAARKRWEDSELTTGNCEFSSNKPLNELVLSRGSGEGMDHSILAIFEDSTVSSESNNDAEEASESLLCALTEMLDRVGQDNDKDEIFSPFDVLPNTALLHRAEHKHKPLCQDPSPSVRLRPRSKPPKETLRTRSNGEQRVDSSGPPQMLKKQTQRLFCSKAQRSEAEVEVFTSTSLISLVKLMHPYCLKLHVEKDGPRKNKSLFSQEEVWRYERPSEESDEEINVVSDDELPLKETKEEEMGGKRGSGPLLKSVLLNGKFPKDKKRVSFGPVHVASFDEYEEEDFEEKTLNTSEGRKTLEASQPPAEPSEGTTAVSQDETEKKKARSLSLQEYKQLRLNRRPPLEKMRKYTTKWPTVSELPKELIPIFPIRGANPAAEYSRVNQQGSNLKEAKLQEDRLKSSKPKPRVSPACAPSDNTARPIKPERRKSQVKKPKLLSSDPPNPVLVPLPAPQSPSKSVSVHSNEYLQKTLDEPSPAPHARSLEPKTNVPPLNKDLKGVNTSPHQETKAKIAATAPRVLTESPPQGWSQSRTEAAEPSWSPDPGRPAECPHIEPPFGQPPAETPRMPKEEFPDTKEPEAPQTDCRGNSAADESGIEAADLTSLLEQFEETQADGISFHEPKAVHAASSSVVEASRVVELGGSEPAASTSPLNSAPKPLNTEESPTDAQTLDVPEPLHTEVVLSTQKYQPRCKSLSSKPIQIIDPRPLPARKARASQSEPSADQIYSYLCGDHDYCGPSSLRAKQWSEPELMSQDSSAAGDGEDQAPALLHPSDPSRTAAEDDTSTEALRFPPSATEGGDNRTALCGLPTPPPTPPVRGRSKRRYRGRSPRSDSSSSSCSSSCSCSPKRPRIHRRRSESSSCSSSPSSSTSPPRRYHMSYSRSRSRSWSTSRSRSPSPQIYHSRWRDVSFSRESRRRRREHEMRVQKLKAIDERRVVYVGRIRRTMTHDELRERFSQFGEVECVSLHFRDSGDHYGFVTFYNTEDAFAAIDNGGKLRKPNELPFDLCFGGRRQFCNSDYADLDANKEADPPSPRSRFEDLDFDSLLKQAQRGLKR